MKRFISIIILLLIITSCTRRDLTIKEKDGSVVTLNLDAVNNYGLTFKQISPFVIKLSNEFAIKSKDSDDGIIYYLYINDVYLDKVYVLHSNVTSIENLIEVLMDKYNSISRPFHFFNKNVK